MSEVVVVFSLSRWRSPLLVVLRAISLTCVFQRGVASMCAVARRELAFARRHRHQRMAAGSSSCAIFGERHQPRARYSTPTAALGRASNAWSSPGLGPQLIEPWNTSDDSRPSTTRTNDQIFSRALVLTTEAIICHALDDGVPRPEPASTKGLQVSSLRAWRSS